MKNKFSFRRVVYTLLSLIIIASGSYLAILYAQGNYRLTKNGVLPEAGLLSANSFPIGAQVFVDGELKTATDDTMYLEPGTYQVRLVKDGYSSWEKELIIKKELVTQTNARLFPVAPSLIPLTFTGVENLLPSPDGRKIVYYTASASATTRNGLYVLDLSDSNLNPFQKTSRQVASDVPLYELGQAKLIWSPDSSQLMVLTPLKQVLIDINQSNNLTALPDISFRRSQILSEWEEEIYLRERQYLAEFPEEIVQIATSSAKNAYISPDKKKLLYTATASASLNENLTPPLPSTNTQPESRQIQPGSIYVYDREEDKNFMVGVETGQEETVKGLLADDLGEPTPRSLITSPSAFTRLQDETIALTANRFGTYHTSLSINTLQWFADSSHLLFIKDDRIQVISYDGSNNTTLYSGPFAKNFVFPWPDGSRMIILTVFSPDSPKNLYSIELK